MKVLSHVKSFIFIVCYFYGTIISSQISINLTSIPESSPNEDPIYLASNHNGWNPSDSNYILTPNEFGIYQISLSPSIGLLEYKFTRGSWNSVEVDANGYDISNRKTFYSGTPLTLNLTIQNWKDISGENSTASENVFILDENFYIPQLNRTRRIWIYTPPNYMDSNTHYSVLYMQDGQNLFDNYTSFSGEWEVDESLNKLFDVGEDGLIVVGIDNGGVNRINEYSPWINPSYGGGEGAKYVDFIIETLKPFIDSTYRTKPERIHTGIMGSSMGALIALYAAIEHQEVFSKVGVFSPSFWFSEEVYTHVQSKPKEADMKIYLLGGEQESSNLIADMEKMVSTLQNAGFEASEVKMITHSDGQHSEWYWRREFTNAYNWLFDNSTLPAPSLSKEIDVKIFPNPSSETLTLTINKFIENCTLEIYNEQGVMVFFQLVPSSGSININTLKKGLYIVQLVKDNNTIFSDKLLHIGL